MSDDSRGSLGREVGPSTVEPSTRSSVSNASSRSNSSNPGIPGNVGFTRTPRTDTIQQENASVQQYMLSQSMIDRQRQAAPSARGNVQYVQSTVNLGQPALLTNPVQLETAFVTQQPSQSMIDRHQQVPPNAQGNVQYVQSTVNLGQPAVSDNISDTISIPTLPYSSANFEPG